LVGAQIATRTAQRLAGDAHAERCRPLTAAHENLARVVARDHLRATDRTLGEDQLTQPMTPLRAPNHGRTDQKSPQLDRTITSLRS
jgi:hypothetical protein